MLTTASPQDQSTRLCVEVRDSQIKYKDRESETFELEVLMVPERPKASSIVSFRSNQLAYLLCVPHRVCNSFKYTYCPPLSEAPTVTDGVPIIRRFFRRGAFAIVL